MFIDRSVDERGLPHGLTYFIGDAQTSIGPEPRPPRLLDRLRLALRAKHYAYRTEQAFVRWDAALFSTNANAIRR